MGAKQWAKEDRLAEDDAIRALLSHRNGRKFLWMVLEWCHVGEQPFSANALNTAFSCGELNVGNRLLSRLMEVNAEGYARMMLEQADERAERNRTVARGGGDESSVEVGGADFDEPG